MNKNTEEKNQERLNLILETALRLYREKSSVEVSVLDICRACKMTKPTFYKYMDSKEQILLHYFQGNLERSKEQLDNMDPDKHLDKIYFSFTQAISKVSKSDADLLRNYFITCLKEQMSANIYAGEWRDEIESEITKAKEVKEISSGESTKTLYIVLASLALGLGLEACSDEIEIDDTLKPVFLKMADSFLLPNHCVNV